MSYADCSHIPANCIFHKIWPDSCIPSIPKCKAFLVLSDSPKSNFSNFDQVYRKMHQYQQHRISFIKVTMNVMIVHLFDIVDVNISFYKFGQN